MVPHLSGRGRRILRGCVRWCWPVVDVMAVYLESPRSRVEKDVVSERKILVEVLGVRFRKVVARTRICVDHVVSTGVREWGSRGEEMLGFRCRSSRVCETQTLSTIVTIPPHARSRHVLLSAFVVFRIFN